MLHVATCGDIGLESAQLGAAVEACALRAGFDASRTEPIGSPFELLDRVMRPQGEAPIDLIVLANSLAGLSGMQAIRDIRASGSRVRIILVAEDPEPVIDALALGISGFLTKPVSEDALIRTLDRILPDISGFHRESVLLRFRDRPRRIPLRRLLYAETQGHDQLLHISGGVEYGIRSTSQELYDKIGDDAGFFKAGSSYIINLRHVRLVKTTSGLAVLSDGSSVTIPVRLRKALKNALMGEG